MVQAFRHPASNVPHCGFQAEHCILMKYLKRKSIVIVLPFTSTLKSSLPSTPTYIQPIHTQAHSPPLHCKYYNNSLRILWTHYSSRSCGWHYARHWLVACRKDTPSDGWWRRYWFNVSAYSRVHCHPLSIIITLKIAHWMASAWRITPVLLMYLCWCVITVIRWWVIPVHITLSTLCSRSASNALACSWMRDSQGSWIVACIALSCYLVWELFYICDIDRTKARWIPGSSSESPCEGLSTHLVWAGWSQRQNGSGKEVIWVFYFSRLHI